MQRQDVRTNAAASPASIKPFQIRGRFFTAVALRLDTGMDDAFFTALDAHISQIPAFFEDAPMVLDLEKVAGTLPKAELVRLIDGLKNRGLSVFGVQNGTEEQAAVARAAGLIPMPGGREVPLERTARKSDPAPKPAPAEPEPEAAPTTRLITEPVRSGQRIFNDRGDLIVVASVSAGAELIAEGSIHIYGRLRGRALAGVNGDTNARIFCQSLDAELLAISGLYKTSESMSTDLLNERVQVFLRDEMLCIEKLA
ncbi:septum site-determining protein MinC [Palleronia aestuarii]|uniref:Probable septum site-determining protein MinC n=1 Tax=Palleronia aestuarii TaxID=568105 RepID=A0A2W7N2Z2_9RHOB|nr:septum site-determining protein MinC [Palleronia aestuarii]PZX14431.1 septum site-determining protein MinC [Palleronia aestuarii]